MPDHIFDQLHIHNWIFSGCGAVGSARHLGCWGRRFEPCHSDHVAADGILFAATFFAKVRARTRRCSSFPNRTRCRWAPDWFLFYCKARFAPSKLGWHIRYAVANCNICSRYLLRIFDNISIWKVYLWKNKNAINETAKKHEIRIEILLENHTFHCYT